MWGTRLNTWTDIRAAFRDITGDTGATIFSAATVARWANLALGDLCEAARYIDEQYVVGASAGVGSYAVTAGGYGVTRVEYDGSVLFPITRNGLRSHARDWSTRTGLPRFYYLTEMSATPDSLFVGLYEIPSSNLANGIRIWYQAYPTAVSDASPSSEIEVPDWAVGAVLFYMLREAYTSDTQTLQDFSKADMYGIMYEDAKQRLVGRARGALPKKWEYGQPGRPSLNVLNRLPDRIPAP